MAQKETDSLRVRLGEDLKPRLDALLADKRITQQAAIVAIIEWLLNQPPLTQSMVLGQIPRDDPRIYRLMMEDARAAARQDDSDAGDRAARRASRPARRRSPDPGGEAA